MKPIFERGNLKLALEIIEVPLTGKITAVKVSAGSKVKEGDVLCLLESMKMQNPIMAPVSGTVKEVKVAAGQLVKSGEKLVTIEY